MSTITALPTPPNRRTRAATLGDDCDNFFAALPGLVTEVNIVAGEVDTNATNALAYKNAAATSAADAHAAADPVTAKLAEITAVAGVLADVQTVSDNIAKVQVADAASSLAVASANFKGQWSSLVGALNVPASVYHGGRSWMLLSNLADVTAAEPGVNAAWAPVFPMFYLSYEERGSLRSAIGTHAVVEDIGMFTWTNPSTEIDDDETCFANSSGRWLLTLPSWSFVDAYEEDLQDEELVVLRDDMNAADATLEGEIQALDTRTTTAESNIAAQATAWPGSILHGTAASSITSIAAVTQTSFTGTVTGAAVGNHVVVNPPDALDAHVSCFARVTAVDTVTIYLNNPSAASATLATGTWQIIVIKP